MRVRGVLTILALALATLPASAQAVPGNFGSTLGVFGGVATGQSETGALVGGSVGWEISNVVGLEGRATWLDRGRGADGFAGSITLVGTWANPTAIKPFVEAGVGLQRAIFDVGQADVPDFYRRRMAPTGLGGALQPDTFTDPSLVLGGGANIFLGRHVAVRPALNVAFVRRDSEGFALTGVHVHLVYHFEDHPVTP